MNFLSDSEITKKWSLWSESFQQSPGCSCTELCSSLHAQDSFAPWDVPRWWQGGACEQCHKAPLRRRVAHDQEALRSPFPGELENYSVLGAWSSNPVQGNSCGNCHLWAIICGSHWSTLDMWIPWTIPTGASLPGVSCLQLHFHSAVLWGLLPSSISVMFGIMSCMGWWPEATEGILSFKSTGEITTNIVK